MEYWEAFQRFEFANETLIVLGGLLVFVALLQIVKSSIKMVFWVVLAVIGSCSALYGYDRSAIRLPENLIEEARNLAGSARLTNGAMQALCLRVLNGDTNSTSAIPSDSTLLLSGSIQLHEPAAQTSDVIGHWVDGQWQTSYVALLSDANRMRR